MGLRHPVPTELILQIRAVIDKQIDTDRHRFAHGHMNEYRKRKLAHSQRCSEFKYIQYQQCDFY